MDIAEEREKITFSVVTLGCAKNTVETEFLEGSLLRCGHKSTDLNHALVIVVVTCGFIESAKQESIDTILELANYKKRGCCRALVVTGCLAQRYPEALFQELPEVDGVIGLSHVEDLHCYIAEILRGKRICKVGAMPASYHEERVRNFSNAPSSYLQIADGCNTCCSYCAIPLIRGGYRSRSIESLITEARNLVIQGTKEIVLIAQDTGCYGVDIYGKPKIDVLIKELDSLEGLKWIRLLYCQPQSISDELIAALADSGKTCPYIDIPLQHANKKILMGMGRKGSVEEYLSLLDRIRAKIPNIAVRTSFILGFPGESEKDFNELMKFIEKAGFDYIGFFGFSPEENTQAFHLPNRVPKEIVRERVREISELADSIAFSKAGSFLGRKVEVLVENIVDEQDEAGLICYQGRTIYQAPEIDGEIRVKTCRNELQIGDMTEADIKSAFAYDFEGEWVC